jgi:hypothetical protein
MKLSAPNLIIQSLAIMFTVMGLIRIDRGDPAHGWFFLGVAVVLAVVRMIIKPNKTESQNGWKWSREYLYGS